MSAGKGIKFYDHPEYEESEASLEPYQVLYDGDREKLAGPKYPLFF